MELNGLFLKLFRLWVSEKLGREGECLVDIDVLMVA
jgi:hypothetical protein